MQKTLLTFLVVMMALVVGGGAALADTVRCEGGPCEGGTDHFSGGSGRDRMTGGPGRDTLYGGTEDDTVAVQDGSYDVVDCGEGNYDAVVVDRGVDSVTNCENVYW